MKTKDYLFGNQFQRYGSAIRINKNILRGIYLVFAFLIPIIVPVPAVALIKKDITMRYEK